MLLNYNKSQIFREGLCGFLHESCPVSFWRIGHTAGTPPCDQAPSAPGHVILTNCSVTIALQAGKVLCLGVADVCPRYSGAGPGVRVPGISSARQGFSVAQRTGEPVQRPGSGRGRPGIQKPEQAPVAFFVDRAARHLAS